MPEVAILATAKRLRLPTREEGFSRCYEVRLEPDATFVITGSPRNPIHDWPKLGS